MPSRFPALLALVAFFVSLARGGESNAWPFVVTRTDEASGAVATEALGPLFGRRWESNGTTTELCRPFLLQRSAPALEQTLLLYPLFTWERRPESERFSFFQLVNWQRLSAADQAPARGFDVWPFYFSRETGDPETSYRALLPLAGTIKHRFGRDRLSWVGFPFYFETLKGEKRGTHTPWPIVHRIAGGGHTGFAVWPLFGTSGRPGDYRHRYWLWPLAYEQADHLSAPQPDVKIGLLPFYDRSTGPGYVSEDFLWPFFGYTHRTEPAAYDEHRYFWPFLVQGRGAKYVNRWAPFYTRSISKGVDKQWWLWPLFRHAEWESDGVAQRKNQLLFFLYWSLEQHSLGNPGAAPASKRHLWPLFSAWDNGAGRRQWQLLSPFDVFFPDNDPIRQLYTPLFALYRYDERGPDNVRWSFLWNAVTSRRTATAREFHFGPLFSSASDGDDRRIAFGNGLFGFARNGSAGWRPFLFDFGRRPATMTTAAPTP